MYAAGFYLGQVGTDNLYRIGLFRTADGAFHRKICLFFCENVPGAVKHGDLVVIRNSEEKPFEDMDTVTMNLMPGWIDTVGVKREETKQDIMYTVENVVVGEKNLPGVGKFYHPHFGVMIDIHGHLYLGKYELIAFVVQPLANDKYQLEIRLGLRENKGTERNDQWKNDNVKIMNELVKAEREQTIKKGTEDWNIIQQLELVAFDSSDTFSGHCPVFRPSNTTDQAVMRLFQRFTAKNAQVRIIPQSENANGEYEDEDCAEPPRGTLMAFSLDRCQVKLKKEFREFYLHHPIGSIFRFEPAMDDQNVAFWSQQKQLENPMFAQTMDADNIIRLKTDVILERLAMDSKQIERLSTGEDKKYPCKLNNLQLKALQMAMNEKRKLVCIQGPPGTGKTMTLATIISHLILQNKQVIVLTPTRVANMNIETMVRKVLLDYRGGEELANTALLNHQRFDELLNKDSEAVEKGIQELRASMEKGEITFEQFVEREQSKLKIAKRHISDRIFSKTLVVFSTINSCFATYASFQSFHPVACFIDEAGQVKESETWPSVIGMTRIILAGDPNQLPSLVKSAQARYYGLERSLIERIMERKEQFSWVMLEEQYKSHPSITEWSSTHFYDGKIKYAGQLKTLQQIMKKKPPLSPRLRKVYDPLVLIDTCYETKDPYREASWEEAVFTNGDMSYQNRLEAEIVLVHYMTLFKRSIDPKKMAIITPYSAQKSLILSNFENNCKAWNAEGLAVPEMADVNVNTVDAYQGQEFDVVIFSMVRSNPKLALGFVSDERRLNVALTRAKYHFCLVGNGFMLAKSHVQSIQNLFKMIQNRKCRFPPCYVKGNEVPYDVSYLKNNFGFNFIAFTKKCNDPAMVEYCVEMQKRFNDPTYQAQTQTEDQAVRALENMCMMPSTSSPPPFFHNQPY